MQQIILDLNNENYFCFNEFSLSRLLNESKRKTKKKFTWKESKQYLVCHGMMMCWGQICRLEGMLHANTILIISEIWSYYINNII
jgi:hypothetical protein